MGKILTATLFVSCAINLLVSLGIIVYIHDRLAGEDIAKNSIWTNTIEAKRIFLANGEGSGHIELMVDGNGPVISIMNPNGVKAVMGAVPIKYGISVGRTRFPAFAVTKFDGEKIWMQPFDPSDESLLEREIVFGTQDENFQRALQINFSLKRSPDPSIKQEGG